MKLYLSQTLDPEYDQYDDHEIKEIIDFLFKDKINNTIDQIEE